MKKSSFLNSLPADQQGGGAVHGTLLKWFFKEDAGVLRNNYDFVFSGGSIRENGSAGITSGQCNSSNDNFHDTNGNMSDAEKELWKGMLYLIKTGKFTPNSKVDISDVYAAKDK